MTDDPAATRRRAAQRQARARERRRRGLVAITVDVDELAIADVLRAAGERLPVDPTREALARGLERLLLRVTRDDAQSRKLIRVDGDSRLERPE